MDKRKTALFRVRSVLALLTSWVGQVLRPKEVPLVRFRIKTYQWHVIGRKKPRPFGRGFVLALPIFPGRHQPSIVGANELNFCVRDGNRWTLIAINTNYKMSITHLFKKNGDPYRIRTDVNGVRGRCLNHLTNGPLVHLQGLEPGTH